jgi:hypothetical protein
MSYPRRTDPFNAAVETFVAFTTLLLLGGAPWWHAPLIGLVAAVMVGRTLGRCGRTGGGGGRTPP